MKSKWTFIGSLAVVLLVALATGLTVRLSAHGEAQAQGPQPGDATGVTGDEPGGVGAYIPVQGRLTDASGNPLEGVVPNVALRIYPSASSVTALCSRTGSLTMYNGLFSTYIPCSSSVIDGRQLYLGVQVGSDDEMTERQPIYPVPYAFSLIPGALISDTMSGTPLNVYNHGTGWGLDVYSAGHDAVHGRTGSSDHAGVAGVSWGSGIGVYGESKDYHGVVGKHTGTGTGTGVYGRSDSPSGWGGYFVNWSTGGVLWLRNHGFDDGSGGGDFIKATDYSGNDTQFRVTTSGQGRSDVGWTTPAEDFAEMLPAVEGLEPGDVLVIGSDGKLARSTQPYQPTVVGVYSTQPGFVGGQPVEGELEGHVPLAVVGVVPVKASAENGPIRPGDLLVASSIPGHAMKASPNPPIGTVIGKALEGLEEKTGIIRMLVILQ